MEHRRAGSGAGDTGEEASPEAHDLSAGSEGDVEQPVARFDDAALQARIAELEVRLANAPPGSDAHARAMYAGLRAVVAELIRRRRQAEKTCETLTRVLEATSDGFVALDADWRYTYVNEHAGRMFGRDPASLIGKHIWTEFPDGVGQPFHLAYARAVAEQQPQQIEAYYPPFDRWFENRIFPYHGGVAVFFLDVTERRLAQGRLAESEARFRAVYEQAAIGIAVVDLHGRFVHANPCLCEMLGYTEAELRQLRRTEITHPDDWALQQAHTAAVLADVARSKSVEKRYLRKDGSSLWVRVTLSAIRDAGGAPEHCVVVVEDVSERIRVEEALRESEARFERIAAHVPGMIYQFVWHPDGSYDMPFVSAGADEMFGLDPGEIRRESLALIDMVHPDDRTAWNSAMRASAATLSDWRWLGRVVLRTGEVKWVEGASRPELHADGRVVWDGLLLDVTEHRRAEERLEESELRYRSLFDHHPDAVYVVDPSGTFASANPACQRLSGYRPEELVGRSFAPLIAAEHRDATAEHFRAALAGSARSFQTAILHRDGKRVEIDVTNVPLVMGGRITGVFGLARDLTAQRELETQLRQAQKMEAVGRLAGGVAHDFNNLLTVITSCARFVADRVQTDVVARADINEVLRASARAAELTKQLLAFGRQQMLQPRQLDVNAQVTRVAAMLQRVIGEDIAVTTELDPEAWPAVADPGQLEQVLMNLAVNARDAMPNGGTLALRTANVTAERVGTHTPAGVDANRYVSFEVEDTGTGIDPAVLPNIFDPFVTTKGPGMGTGLGLATVYGIVEQSGGHIYVDSTPGVGTRFTVLLPRAGDGRSDRPTPAPAPAIPTGNEAILLVEDDASVRAVVRRMLETQGYAVTEAASAADAVRVMEAWDGHVDLLMVDVVMPDLNGRALAEQLRARWRGLRVIYMSGYTDDEILRRGLVEPGVAFLAKPFSPDRLAHAVREALDSPVP